MNCTFKLCSPNTSIWCNVNSEDKIKVHWANMFGQCESSPVWRFAEHTPLLQSPGSAIGKKLATVSLKHIFQDYFITELFFSQNITTVAMVPYGNTDPGTHPDTYRHTMCHGTHRQYHVSHCFYANVMVGKIPTPS